MKKIYHAGILLALSTFVFTQLPMVFFYKGMRQVKTENYTEAKVFFTRALQLDPDFSKAYYNRALVKFHLKEYTSAIDDYTKAIESDTLYTDAYYHRGVVYYELGDYPMAITDFSKALKIHPGYKEAEYNKRITEKKEKDAERLSEIFFTVN